MKEKKHSADWNIAATHYLTAGFAIPLIINLIGGIILITILPEGIILFIALLLLGLLSVWLGVKYSANYIRKKYIITNKEKIAKLTTIYFTVLAILYLGGQLLIKKISGIETFFEIIRLTAVGVILFTASKKYITENTQNISEKISTSTQ